MALAGSISAAHCRMALRVAHGERAGLIAWMEGLQEKHPTKIDRMLIDSAKELHKSCFKKLKRAIKDAASGGSVAAGFELARPFEKSSPMEIEID